jgi:cobalt-zinc-cadmium efflux system outer membrane protein
VKTKPSDVLPLRPGPSLLSQLRVGCAAFALAGAAVHAAPPPQTTAPAGAPSAPPEVLVLPTLNAPVGTAAPPNLPFAGMAELSPDALVEQVLARNPTLAQMVAAWQAAQARYPQVTSLEDPMFGGTIGPGTIAPDDPGIEFAYRLEISQKLPYPGKLRLRGENALAEARAAGNDVEDTRLQLIESARLAFYGYYLADRALEVNAQSLELLRKFRDSAHSRYVNNLVSAQDVVQVDVEIGREQDRRLALEEAQRIAVARINTLMHLPPYSPLPPPPRRIDVTNGLPDAQVLLALALARRPDLRALADRIRAEQASLGLAYKEYYPDFEPSFMYDRFMGNMTANRDMATMLGVRLNLPIYLAKRRGAVDEATARVAQRRAELARLADQAGFEVQQAYVQVQRSEQSVRLYEQTILPKANQNVEAARSAYESTRIPLLTLVEADRDYVLLHDRYYEAVADYFRRRATLERAVGGSLDPAAGAVPDRPCSPGSR